MGGEKITAAASLGAGKTVVGKVLSTFKYEVLGSISRTNVKKNSKLGGELGRKRQTYP